MNYLFLAQVVTTLHTLLIAAVLLGIIVSIRYKRYRPIEALILLSAVLIWSLYSGCPLTHLESNLRVSAGQTNLIDQMGFIPFYADQWFGILITRQQILLITYITAIIFFAISIKWISPYINPEIVKLRKIFHLNRR